MNKNKIHATTISAINFFLMQLAERLSWALVISVFMIIIYDGIAGNRVISFEKDGTDLLASFVTALLASCLRFTAQILRRDK